MNEVEAQMEIILNECCKFYNTSKHAVVKRARFKNVVEAKRSYCFICHKLGLGASLDRIAKHIKLDHSSFIYHVRTATERAKIYKSYACQLDYLEHHCSNEIKRAVGGHPYLMAMNSLGRAYLLYINVNIT